MSGSFVLIASIPSHAYDLVEQICNGVENLEYIHGFHGRKKVRHEFFEDLQGMVRGFIESLARLHEHRRVTVVGIEGGPCSKEEAHLMPLLLSNIRADLKESGYGEMLLRWLYYLDVDSFMSDIHSLSQSNMLQVGEDCATIVAFVPESKHDDVCNICQSVDYLHYVHGFAGQKFAQSSFLVDWQDMIHEHIERVVREDQVRSICIAGIAGETCSMQVAQVMPALLHSTKEQLLRLEYADLHFLWLCYLEFEDFRYDVEHGSYLSPASSLKSSKSQRRRSRNRPSCLSCNVEAANERRPSNGRELTLGGLFPVLPPPLSRKYKIKLCTLLALLLLVFILVRSFWLELVSMLFPYNGGHLRRVQLFQGHTDNVTSLLWWDDSLLLSGSLDRTLRAWYRGSPDCHHTVHLGGPCNLNGLHIFQSQWPSIFQKKVLVLVENRIILFGDPALDDWQNVSSLQFPSQVLTLCMHQHLDRRDLNVAVSAGELFQVFNLERAQNLPAGWSNEHTRYTVLHSERYTGGLMRYSHTKRWLAGSCKDEYGIAGACVWSAFEDDPHLHPLAPVEEKYIYLGQMSMPHNILISKEGMSFNCMAWSPDGRFFAAGSRDGNVYIWDVSVDPLARFASGTWPRMLRKKHRRQVTHIAWAAHSKTLASGSDDGAICIWSVSGKDPTQWKQLEEVLQGHDGSILSLAWSPNGNMLASASSDSSIRLWSWQH